MLRKTVCFILLPIVAIMALSGICFRVIARQQAEEVAERRVRSSAQLTSELLASRLDALHQLLHATVTQSSLSDYLMYRQAGLLDEAEQERNEIERSLLKMASGDSGIVSMGLFDREGDRFVAVENQQRTLRPLSVAGQADVFHRTKADRTVQFLDSGDVRVWHARRCASNGELLALASVTYRLAWAVDDAASFAARHLEHCQIRIVDQDNVERFRYGSVSPSAAVVRATAPLVRLPGKVEIVHEEQKALAGFHHSQSTLFLALGGVTVLLIVMTSLGTRYVTRELQEKQQQLLVSRQQADEANQAKTDFLANMSHEIRTPMTAVLGFAELLKSENLSRAEVDDCLETVLRNGRHLLMLINRVLDLTKIEAGKLELELRDCSPAAVLDDVARLFEAQAEEKGIALEYRVEGPLPAVIRTDPTQLKQALINLVANAIKFTEQGSVEMIALCDWPAETVTYEVADTGSGLTADQIERIFQPFLQADNSTTRKHGGTGLGLSITKQIAALLGGDVRVESTPGRGSRFSLTVSAGPLDQPPGESTTSRTASEGAVKQAAAPPVDPLPQLPPLVMFGRVLLVEDGRDNQRLLTRMLEQARLEVTLAENGRQAFDAAMAAWQNGEPFDVILMDLQMPVMDGYSATAALREQGYGGEIVALTAHAMQSDVQRCLTKGFNAYFSKPVERSRFVAEVLRRIRLKRAATGKLEIAR